MKTGNDTGRHKRLSFEIARRINASDNSRLTPNEIMDRLIKNQDKYNIRFGKSVKRKVINNNE